MGGNIPALSGLRGIAAVTVFLSHSAYYGFLPSFPVAYTGSVGVMLFFSLSGFLMAHLYLSRSATLDGLVDYGWARVARIAPLYFAVLLASMALFYSGVPLEWNYRISVDRFIDHALLAADLGIFWTISAEFQFYVAFALLWWLCALGGGKRVGQRIVVAALALYLAFWWFGFPGHRIEFSVNGPFFLLGMVAAVLHPYVRERASPQAASVALTAMLGLYVLAWPQVSGWFVDGQDDFRSIALHWLMAGVVLSASVARASIAARFLSSRVMVYLGEVSFGIYLLHFAAIGIVIELVEAPSVIWFPVVFALTMAMAHLAYRLIEQPGRSFLRRRSSARAVAQPVVGTA
jgi:peptidoglycan/LPS O-acetylase OafA/YrhL